MSVAVKEAENIQKKSGSWKKRIGIAVVILAVLYIGISIFFLSHYFFGTKINGYDCQFKTADEVKTYMKEYGENYTLTLKERLDREEVITASDLSLTFVDDGKLEKIKEEQNGFLWIKALFQDYEYEKAVTFEYDEAALKAKFDALDCFDKTKVIAPENAYPRYSKYNKKYMIVSEVEGNTVKSEELFAKIETAIQNDEYVIDLDEAGCYENPEYYRDNEAVIAANDTLNQYASAKITYDMDYTTEVVDAADIHKWLSVDENYEVTIDKTKIRDFMTWMGEKYNTAGRTRQFTTPGGSTISVSGGTYGWRLNQVDETEKLYKLVKKGAVKKRTPLWIQKGLPRDKDGDDIADTYIAISTSAQYMWFYKDGECLISTSVVTGDTTKGRGTPSGVYAIAFKQRNHTLTGQGYASFVNYWLPFYEYRGIGIHDASWRSSYGGSIYRGNGSHGCVNTPYSAVQYIYENVEVGTPVIVY
ncbi:MAG: L,D-transpeptidase family protein [Lachnospiraceae bacterium]|nr:L,D-transpeptidase family protein [Lachnospiraceae bacterium]